MVRPTERGALKRKAPKGADAKRSVFNGRLPPPPAVEDEEEDEAEDSGSEHGDGEDDDDEDDDEEYGEDDEDEDDEGDNVSESDSNDASDSGSSATSESDTETTVLQGLDPDTSEPPQKPGVRALGALAEAHAKRAASAASAAPLARKEQPRGVIYLGRIPHGFYEDEMRGYFSQFGKVTRLRLSRNKKTGASKHYAFIEFEHAQVAPIVAEAMHNYLLMGRLLQCHVVRPEDVHDDLFRGANKRFHAIPLSRRIKLDLQRPRSAEQMARIGARRAKRERRARAAIADAGIDYEYVRPGAQKSKKRRS